LIRYVVVMVEPEFEESVGFVARAMRNFGLTDLILVNPLVTVGSLARARAGHAQDVLDQVRLSSSLKKAVRGTDLAAGTTAQRARSPYRILRRPSTPREFSERVRGVRGTVALVFGREGTGLTNEELDLCDLIITIPASEEYPTLNISHAATTIFYELHNSNKNDSREVLADTNVRAKLLEFIENAAFSAGLTETEIGLATRAFRNVMGRSAIRAREASSLAGTFRAIATKLEHQSRPSHDAVAAGHPRETSLEEARGRTSVKVTE